MTRVAIFAFAVVATLACSAPSSPPVATTCVITSCYPRDDAPQWACSVPVGAVFTCDDPSIELSWTGDPGASVPATCRNGQSACAPGLACLVQTEHDGNAMGICQ